MEYTIDRKRLILELAIALVFVALLLILSISVIKNTKQQEKEKTQLLRLPKSTLKIFYLLRKLLTSAGNWEEWTCRK